MPQQINLLDALPKPPRCQLSENSIFLIIGSVLLLLVFTTFLQALSLHANKNKRDSLKKAYADSYEAFIKTSQLYARTSTVSLENTVQDKKIMLQNLQARKITSGQCSFLSNYFITLSQTALPGLWLTAISIDLNNDQIALSGMTYSSALLLKLVQKLNKTGCFSGRALEALELNQENFKADIKDSKNNQDAVLLRFFFTSSPPKKIAAG